VLDAIQETTDYLFENGFKASEMNDDAESESRKLNITQSLCEMLAEAASHVRPTFRHTVLRTHFSYSAPGRHIRSVEENSLPAAISLGMAPLAKQLILGGQDGVKATYFGDPLSCAIRIDDIRLVTMLCEAWKEPHLKKYHIYQAAKLGHNAVLQLLMGLLGEASAVDETDVGVPEIIDDSIPGEDLGLRYGHVVNLVHPGARRMLYETAIQGASSGGKLEMIHQLVRQAAGQGLLFPTEDGTSLHESEDIERTVFRDEMYEWHFGQMCDEEMLIRMILRSAVPANQIHIVQFAIDLCKRLSHKCFFVSYMDLHYTFIPKAIRRGHYDMVQLLVDQTGSEMQDFYKKLHFAVAIDHGYIQIARLFGKLNGTGAAHPTMNKAIDNAFYGTLVTATRKGRTDCVKYLIDERLDELQGNLDSFIVAYKQAKKSGLTSTMEYIAGCGLFSEEEIRKW
jgi:hypothetical protein